MTIKGKIQRGNTVKFIDASGFSATIELHGVFSADMLKACADIDDVQRCADMGDFRITGYDLEVVA